MLAVYKGPRTFFLFDKSLDYISDCSCWLDDKEIFSPHRSSSASVFKSEESFLESCVTLLPMEFVSNEM